MSALLGETKLESLAKNYWNSKKTPASKGDQVKGWLVRMEAGEYNKKPTTTYVIRGSDGEIYLPNHSDLNGKMSRVPTGRTVRVVYTGKGESTRGRNAPELYEVYLTSDPIQKPNQSLDSIQEGSNPIIDPAGAVLGDLKKAPSGMEDKPFWQLVMNHVSNMGKASAVVEKLKASGDIYNDHGIWKATS